MCEPKGYSYRIRLSNYIMEDMVQNKGEQKLRYTFKFCKKINEHLIFSMISVNMLIYYNFWTYLGMLVIMLVFLVFGYFIQIKNHYR